MFDTIFQLITIVAYGYVAMTVLAVKRYVVDRSTTEPKDFWFMVVVFTALSYLIKLLV